MRLYQPFESKSTTAVMNLRVYLEYSPYLFKWFFSRDKIRNASSETYSSGLLIAL